MNGCTSKDVDLMIDAAMALWRKRSAKKWAVLVAPALLKKYPTLEAVGTLG